MNIHVSFFLSKTERTGMAGTRDKIFEGVLESGLHDVAAALLEYALAGDRIFLLTGDLGAGKTTLVKAFAKVLGIVDPVTSPTFSLVQEYGSPQFGRVVHMDLYRIVNPEELVQLGLEEYLDSGDICLIEWPAIAMGQILPPYVRIDIRPGPGDLRTFSFTTHDTVDP